MTDDATTLGFTPDWPTCAHDTGRCVGRRIDEYEHCLAHLARDDLDTALGRLTPRADLDLRGTTLTAQLLNRLLTHMNNSPADHDSPAHLGRTDFSHCSFPAHDHDEDPPNTSTAAPLGYIRTRGFTNVRFGGDANFGGAQFSGYTNFNGAQFSGDASFRDAQFGGNTKFGSAQFNGVANFGGATFRADAVFVRAIFSGTAWFGAQFSGTAFFMEATFGASTEFGGARFGGDASFLGTQFSAGAVFVRAQFSADAEFSGAQFGGNARFIGATFSEGARFDKANFSTDAEFGGAQFSRDANFIDTTFGGTVRFIGAQFGEFAIFSRTQFSGNADFGGVQFSMNARFGPLVARGLSLDKVVFAKRVVVELEAGVLSASDARFEGGAELRVRYARVALQRTFFGGPSSLSGAPMPFTPPLPGSAVPADREQTRAWTAAAGGSVSGEVNGRRAVHLEEWIPRVLSLQETDVSQLTLTDVDLRWCRFAGAHQLDKLRLEGRGPFNRPPPGWWIGWALPPVWRWTSRRVLAEEHPWRAGRCESSGWIDSLPGLHGAADTSALGPERLAVTYRSLRKALEDARNEAGAGDFYYGEMEARRHAPSTGRWERVLLTTYWMLSGYGQRASRTLAALLVLFGVLFVLLTSFGLPHGTVVQQMTGTIPAAVVGQPRQVTIEVKPVPATLPPEGRWSSDRMAKAARVALGSVVFRDADQQLTPQGQWTVMAGRAFGPLLLALAALAVRARVKR